MIIGKRVAALIGERLNLLRKEAELQAALDRSAARARTAEEDRQEAYGRWLSVARKLENANSELNENLRLAAAADEFEAELGTKPAGDGAKRI